MKIAMEKTMNGVDTAALQDVIKNVSANPDLGRSKFRITNQWIDGGLNRTTVGKFYAAGREQEHHEKLVYENDEPAVLLSGDKAGNPVEFLLHALAGCVTTTTVYHAAARGIRIRKLQTAIEGDLDLQGLLQIDPAVKCGFQNIRVRMEMDADANQEQLEELKQLYRFSPVFGTLMQPANIKVNVDVQPSGK